MGREYNGPIHWNGEVAHAKVLLESREIILRGGAKARIDRASLQSVDVIGDRLHVASEGRMLVVEMGPDEARKWAEVLRRPPPTLAQKLGIDPTRQALVLGQTDDEAVLEAIAGAQTQNIGDAVVVLAILAQEADLPAALAVAGDGPSLPIWCIHPKGKGTPVSDAFIRSTMRAHGFVDNKTSAVSDQLTTTRYVRPANGNR